MEREEGHLRGDNPLSEYHHLYLEEDKFDIWHESEDYESNDLDIIKIKLPSLTEFYSKHLGRPIDRDEALTYVHGYGKNPLDQKWNAEEVMSTPQRIKDIYSIVFEKKKKESAKYKDVTDVEVEDIYNELYNNADEYEEEILWIKRFIKRRYFGMWIFIKGKPTYLNGANFFFLTQWYVKNKGKNSNLPDYRDYQRKMFNMLMYGYTTTDAFFKHRVTYRDINGKKKVVGFNSDIGEFIENLKEEKGVSDYYLERNINWVYPTGKRTCHGVNFISSRRVAKTAIACCFGYWITTNEPDQTFIIQAMNDDHAKNKIYNKQILTPFSRMLFFNRPYFKTREESSSGLKFQYDSAMLNAARAGIIPDAMECFITPLSSMEKAADGEMEIAYVYRDEPAKKLDDGARQVDIPTWWYNTMKPAIERGDNIWGYAVLPSTVGDMDTGGGAQFLKIVNDSHYSDRNDNGVTSSGLLNFFLAGYYAVEGMLDEYGYSIIDDPEEPILNEKGETITVGAKTKIKNKADDFERKGNWEALIKHQQNFPTTWREAFAIVPQSMGMPIHVLREAIKNLKFSRPPKTVRLNLKWAGGEFGGDVYVENDPKGDWVMGYLPPMQFRNKRTIVSPQEGYIQPKDGGPIYAPDASVAGKMYIPCDPVKFHKRNVTGSKKSKAAATVFYKQDPSVDMQDGQWKPRSEWVSNDWIMFYCKDVDDKNEYHEEWLKACILLGAYLYPEYPDGEDVTDYFQIHGFDGYLLRDMGPDDKVAQRPGVWAGTDSINSMIGDTMTFFKNNAMYCKIWEILEEWTKMRGVDDLTNHDLCAASGWAMSAIKSRLPEVHTAIRETVVVEGGFDLFEIMY